MFSIATTPRNRLLALIVISFLVLLIVVISLLSAHLLPLPTSFLLTLAPHATFPGH